ncbi:hypothetical protein MAXJ12_11757 [Mesorhizobium alhagi CCNWXJ12-2]|uniref:Uncharacterized protein n=1 Tax=Mesorhizobium alhagi CCNWXJ12-2 TaxID=1107882 RepID=H0HQC1_9HYPH|nr:hypothetical protein MAXJ12_11757 [Mesorhizobium alhagi CCNWXJ12-2]
MEFPEMMNKQFMTLAFLCVATITAVIGADAETKKVLKHFQFARGSITFYDNHEWENIRNGSRNSGRWEWLGNTHVCPVEWKNPKQQAHCRKYYRVK